MKHIFTIALLLCLCVTARAQSDARTKGAATVDQQGPKHKITGRVVDDAGAPLVGATVAVQDSRGKTVNGTVTDESGTYSLEVDANQSYQLKISYVGTADQLIQVDPSVNEYATTLHGSATTEDVVVVGYGTQKRSDLTGAIATVGSKDFQTGQITSPDQLIAGKLAGVSVTPGTGLPGAGSTIRIRSGSSLNASNDPLIVLNGVPQLNESISGAANPLATINPNDIESFTVLKDASAAAIYGNRASNGVILITTKKGVASDQVSVTVSSINSLATTRNRVDVLSTDQFRTYVNTHGAPSDIANLGTASTNWQDQIYQTAFTTDNNITISGGIKNLPYRLSVGYLDQSGILKTGDLKRTTATISITPSFLNNHLLIDFNVTGSYSDNRFANADAVGAAVRMDPTKPVYDANSKYNGYYEWTNGNIPNTLATRNPVGLLNDKTDVSTVKRSIGNLSVIYKLPFLPELSVQANVGYDLSMGTGSVSWPFQAAATYFAPKAGKYAGSYLDYSQYKRNLSANYNLHYVKDIASIDSKIDVLAGYEYQDFFRGSPSNPTYNTARDSIRTAKGIADSTRHTTIGLIGRLVYSFKDRYIVTASIRRDATSRYGPDYRWGNFPAVSAAWKINEEAFLKDNHFISELKLRFGYGQTGNQDGISDYSYLPNYNLSSGNSVYYFGSQAYPLYAPQKYDAKLHWEKTATSNVAIDYGLFGGKLFGSLDLYYKKTTDLLASVPTPALSNFGSDIVTNVGSIENKGIELSINATPISNQDIKWNVGFNLTYQESKITKLSNNPDPTSPGIPVGGISGGTGNTIQIFSVGSVPYTFYVLHQNYGADGKPIQGSFAGGPNNFYQDKSPLPKYILGFTTQFSYKKWDVSAVLRANIGNYVYNNVASSLGTGNAIINSSTSPTFLANGVSDVFTTGFTNSQYFSDYYVQKASFLRMDNLTFGYNYGQIGSTKVKLRISGNVQNVFVITPYKGLDPEVFGGIDGTTYPRPRTYSIGINLTY